MIKLKFQETVELMKAIPRRKVEGVEKPVYTIESEMDCPITGMRIVALFNDPRFPILYYHPDYEAWLLTHTMTTFSWKHPMRCFKGSLSKMSDVKNANAVKGMPFGFKSRERQSLLICCPGRTTDEKVVISSVMFDAWAVKMFFPHFDKALMNVLFRYLDEDTINLACKLSSWFKSDFGMIYNDLVIHRQDYKDLPKHMWRLMTLRAQDNTVFPVGISVYLADGPMPFGTKNSVSFYKAMIKRGCSRQGWKWLLNERGHTRFLKRRNRLLDALSIYANMCSQIPGLKKMTKSIAAEFAHIMASMVSSSSTHESLLRVIVQILRWINDGPGIKGRIAHLIAQGDYRHLFDYFSDIYRDDNWRINIPREDQKLPGIAHIRRYEQWCQDQINQRFTISKRALEHSWDTFLKEYTRDTEKHKFRAEALTTGEQLQDESRKMHHCVYSYWSSCSAESRQIYRIFQDDKHVATVELLNRTTYARYDYAGNQTNAEIETRWSLSQCYGPCNQHTSDAVREFAAHLSQAYQEAYDKQIQSFMCKQAFEQCVPA